MPSAAAEVSGLHINLLNALEQVDAALDRDDRRLFVVWCRRVKDLKARLSGVLLAAATEPRSSGKVYP